MPLVNIHMAEGRTPEQKRALMEAITEAMVTHVGAARESVRVWILEFPATDFMAGGELLAAKRARLAAEAAEAEAGEAEAAAQPEAAQPDAVPAGAAAEAAQPDAVAARATAQDDEGWQ
jgi:4-oxalocrotonate tautomerase